MNWLFMLRSTHLKIVALNDAAHLLALEGHVYELNVERAKLKAEQETVAELREVVLHLERVLEDYLKDLATERAKLKAERAKLKAERETVAELRAVARCLKRKLEEATNRSGFICEAAEDIFKYLNAADAPETGTPKTYIDWLKYKLGTYLGD